MPATITRQNGSAGQISYTAVTDDGPLTFVGSTYGGPIAMVLPSGVQTFVTDPGRFGSLLNETWVRSFLECADSPDCRDVATYPMEVARREVEDGN